MLKYFAKFVILFCSVLILSDRPLFAQDKSPPYPSHPIRLIVGFPPGGPNDLIAREIAIRLADSLKQPVVVENKVGSNAEIATGFVAKAIPDGYTLLFGSSGSLAVSPNMQSKLSYDPIKDFSPIALVASNPMLLLVSSQSRFKSLNELINQAKESPGAITFASAGSGSPTQLSAILMERMAGIQMLHVPYKGGGPAMIDLISGQVDIYFGGLSTALPFVKDNKLRPLAITSPQRNPILEGIPALSESLPGYESMIWYGILAPANTPKNIINLLATTVLDIENRKEFRDSLSTQGAQVMAEGPEKFSTYLKTELKKWGEIVKSAKLDIKEAH